MNIVVNGIKIILIQSEQGCESLISGVKPNLLSGLEGTGVVYRAKSVARITLVV